MSNAAMVDQGTFTDKAGNLYHPHAEINGLSVADAEQRMDFLPAYFTSAFMAFEGAVLDMARKTIKGYTGGYWEYALTESGLPFVYPKHRIEGDELPRLTVSNVFDDEHQDLHPVLAGIITTMVALIIMMENAEKLDLTDAEEEAIYDLRLDLRDYALNLGKALGDEQDRAFYKLFN